MRLVDVDALKQMMPAPIEDEYKRVHQIIDSAPTVEKSQDEWISVDDELPQDMQNVLIWFEYYRYGDFNCMYQTYGFGYVCDGKWSPFINGTTGWQDYRVIAWQSLPEPYTRGDEI